MIKSTIPVNESGDWKIEKFSVSEADAQFHNLRCVLNNRKSSMITPGDYTKLTRNGKIIMSDTPSEILDHENFIAAAKGSILIAGLGLGIVTSEVMKKRNVTSVVVVEKSEDVLELVWRHLPQEFAHKVEFVCADIFDYKPKHSFDYAWFDIWDYICEDNLADFKVLDAKYRSRVLNIGYWALQQLVNENYKDLHEFINLELFDSTQLL